MVFGVGVDQRFIDTGEFTRLGRQLQGQVELQSLSRLVSDLPEQGGAKASWDVRGLQDAAGQAMLEVRVTATPILECQRCVQPMAWPVDAYSRLLVVDSEEGLEARDDLAESPDDWVEPVLASARLDVLELVEDELILALPAIPLHEHCEHPAGLADTPDDAPERVSAFEALRRLKKN